MRSHWKAGIHPNMMMMDYNVIAMDNNQNDTNNG